MELMELMDEVLVAAADGLVIMVLLTEAELTDAEVLIEESLEPDEQAVTPIIANTNTK